MVGQGVKASDVDNAASVAEAILPRIGWYFHDPVAVIDYEVDIAEEVVYAALQLPSGEISAYIFWYTLRDYPDANILFDCEWEGGYYDWVKDFHYAACPPRILDKLTPTENKSALNWRGACRDNWRKNHDENT